MSIMQGWTQWHFVCHHLELWFSFIQASGLKFDMTQNGSRVQILGTQLGESLSTSPKVFPTAKQTAQQRGQWKRHFSSVQTLSCNWCCFGDLQVYSEIFCSCRKDFKIKVCFQLYEVFDCEKRYSGNKYTQVPWLVPGADKFLLLIHI